MGFICAVQVLGLVRGDTSKKHRGNGLAVILEMAKERISKSETLDENRTKLNVYDQTLESGYELWDDITRRASEYKQEVKGKTKKGEEIIRYKGLRKDAVVSAAVIINPPYEACFEWTDEQYKKFYQDTSEILEEFCPEIFRKSNKIYAVEHVDEGYDDNDRHKHMVYDCIDEGGHYCGNKLDAKFFSDFNKLYPEQMRKRGWDMDNLDTTDWDRYKSDSEYRESRKAKWKAQGKSVNQHIKDKAVANFKESVQILDSAKQLLDKVEKEKEDAKKELKELREKKQKLEHEMFDKEQELAALEVKKQLIESDFVNRDNDLKMREMELERRAKNFAVEEINRKESMNNELRALSEAKAEYTTAKKFAEDIAREFSKEKVEEKSLNIIQQALSQLKLKGGQTFWNYGEKAIRMLIHRQFSSDAQYSVGAMKRSMDYHETVAKQKMSKKRRFVDDYGDYGSDSDDFSL